MNKKFSKFIKSIDFYKTTLPKKYKNRFDEVASLYLDRKIEKSKTVTNILDKFHNRGSGPKSAIKLIEKYQTYEPATGIKEKGREIKAVAKWYHVKLDYTLRTMKYKKTAGSQLTDKEASTYEDNKNKFKNVVEDATYKIFSSDKKVFTKNPYDAVKMLEDEEYENHREKSGYDVYYRYDVVKTWNLTYNAETGNEFKTENMPMSASKPYEYYFIEEDTSKLKYKGECVIDNMIGIYAPLIKNFEEKFNKYCDEVEKNDSAKTSLQIKRVCERLDISMYAYDLSQHCFMKNVSKNMNYPALVYYAINNHMYLVTDKDKVLSLVASARDKQNHFKTTCLSTKSPKDCFTKGFEIKEDVSIKQLFNLTESCIIIYNKPTLNQELNDLMSVGNVPQIKRSNRTNITYMTVKINKNIFHLFADRNDVSVINHHNIQSLCDKTGVAFKNQTLPSLVRTLKDDFINFKHDRKSFTDGERNIFLRKHKTCNYCAKVLNLSIMEIDHILRLADGGDNEESNLQALCKECHFEKSQDEQNTLLVSKTHSSFNLEVQEIIDSSLSQSLAFVEKVARDINYGQLLDDINYVEVEDNETSIDVNKCRANQMLFNKYDYPKFTVMDGVEIYNGQSSAGKYYIESNHGFPLHGNGWYQLPMVDFCLAKKIIEPSDIKYCIIASLTVPHDYFNKFIYHCRDVLGDYGKLAINSMIGSFAVNSKNTLWQCTKITTNVNEAFDFFLQDKETFVDQGISDQGKYYSVFKEIDSITCESEKPIYNMIMELEAIELYKLSQIIESNGGKVLDLKTDCIRCRFDCDVPFTSSDGLNLDGYYFDEQCKVPKYKFETATALTTDRKPKWIRTEQFKMKDKKWAHFNDVSDNDFMPLVNQILDVMGSCNIQASAGCGKTTLIEKFLKPELIKRSLSYTVLTPTNISALLVGGTTLDKFTAKIKTKESLEKYTTNYFIVDEVSMMKEVNYKLLSVIKSFNPSTKFIISGDFEQLQPVKDIVGERTQLYYQDSNILHELCDGNRLTLTTCRRSDSKLFNLCKDVKSITKDQFSNQLQKHNICFTNEKRKEINDNHMKAIKKTRKMGDGLKLQKLNYDKNSQDVELFSLMPIMSSKNQPVFNKEKIDIFNNEMFTIKK